MGEPHDAGTGMVNRKVTRHGTTHRRSATGQRLTTSLWLAMLLLHGPGLVSAFGTLAQGVEFGALLRAVGLSLSAGLFVLKIADVPWLRMHANWRSAVAATVVIALMHVGVARRVVSGELVFTPQEVGAVLCLGTVHEVVRQRRRVAWLRQQLRARWIPRRRTTQLALLAWLEGVADRVAAPQLLPATVGTRAPPAHPSRSASAR